VYVLTSALSETWWDAVLGVESHIHRLLCSVVRGHSTNDLDIEPASVTNIGGDVVASYLVVVADKQERLLLTLAFNEVAEHESTGRQNGDNTGSAIQKVFIPVRRLELKEMVEEEDVIRGLVLSHETSDDGILLIPTFLKPSHPSCVPPLLRSYNFWDMLVHVVLTDLKPKGFLRHESTDQCCLP